MANKIAKDEAARNEAADAVDPAPAVMTADPDAIDAVDAEAGAVAAAADDYQTYQPEAEQAGYTTTEGTRVANALAMKDLLPVKGDAINQWIAANVLVNPIGHITLIGRIYGGVTGYSRKVTRWKDKDIASIALEGIVNAETADGRRIGPVSLVFLPSAFAAQVVSALDMGDSRVAIDVDVGLSPTGKAIAYQWEVVSYLEGRAQRALRRMGNARQIGKPPVNVGQLLIA